MKVALAVASLALVTASVYAQAQHITLPFSGTVRHPCTGAQVVFAGECRVVSHSRLDFDQRFHGHSNTLFNCQAEGVGSDGHRYRWHRITNESTHNVGCHPNENQPFFRVHGHNHEQFVSQSGEANFFANVHLIVHFLGCGFPPDEVEVIVIASEQGCRG